jgi:LPS O-antigen subunit length determinant protein (WzzB/FepE family)
MNQQFPTTQPGQSGNQFINPTAPQHSPPHQTANPLAFQQSLPPRDPDEINLLEYAYVLVHNKWWIIGATVLGLIIGLAAAYIKGPTWVAEAVIAAKESDTQKSPSISALGALGGLVASQLNIAGNPGLDKIDQIIASRKFNADLISKNDLLPLIFKLKMPKTYRKYFDVKAGKWRPGFIAPDSLAMGDFLAGAFVKKETKENLLTLKISSKDSAFSYNLMTGYLAYLDEYIRTTTQTEARNNVSYLDSQMVRISDPLLREKIQNLIANEIEKAMLVSKEAFRVADPPYLHKQFKEKKLYTLVFGAGMFFMVCLLAILMHAFSAAEKTEEDKNFILAIKREIIAIK